MRQIFDWGYFRRDLPRPAGVGADVVRANTPTTDVAKPEFTQWTLRIINLLFAITIKKAIINLFSKINEEEN